jgi:hypothetical protein
LRDKLVKRFTLDRNVLLPSDSSWYLVNAWGINNHKQIVGWGNRYAPSGQFLGTRAFLLQVPKPSSVALRVMGGIGACLLPRRGIGAKR